MKKRNSNNEDTGQDDNGEDNNEHQGDFAPGRYDTMPTPTEMDGTTDSIPTRPRASERDIFNDKFAVVDHISLEHCFGGEGASFRYSDCIPRQCRTAWCTAFGQTCEALTEALHVNPNEHGMPASFELSIERRVKMFYIFPSLILRKPVLENSSNVPLKKIIKSRLNQWLHHEWSDLIKAFEADMVTVAETSRDTFGSNRDPLESNYQKATALIQTGQLRRARQAILSTGASDPTIPHVKDQMRSKFPTRKRTILEPTPAQ